MTNEDLIALIKQLLAELLAVGTDNRELLMKAKEVVEYEELRKSQ